MWINKKNVYLVSFCPGIEVVDNAGEDIFWPSHHRSLSEHTTRGGRVFVLPITWAGRGISGAGVMMGRIWILSIPLLETKESARFAYFSPVSLRVFFVLLFGGQPRSCFALDMFPFHWGWQWDKQKFHSVSSTVVIQGCWQTFLLFNKLIKVGFLESILLFSLPWIFILALSDGDDLCLSSPSLLPLRTAHRRRLSVHNPHHAHCRKSDRGDSEDGDDEIELWWGRFESSPSLSGPCSEIASS